MGNEPIPLADLLSTDDHIFERDASNSIVNDRQIAEELLHHTWSNRRINLHSLDQIWPFEQSDGPKTNRIRCGVLPGKLNQQRTRHNLILSERSTFNFARNEVAYEIVPRSVESFL